MADTLDVLTLVEGKEAINITRDDQNDVVARHITAVSRLLDRECGPIVQRTVTAEVHDDPGAAVSLRYAPVASIGTVREAFPGEVTTLDVCGFGDSIDGYYAEPDFRGGTLLSGSILRRRLGVAGDWSRGVQVEVTYTAGRYATTEDVDARFKDCAGSILRRLWKREAGTWAQSAAIFETIDAESASPSSGFYRVAKPIIKEQLWADMRLPGIG